MKSLKKTPICKDLAGYEEELEITADDVGLDFQHYLGHANPKRITQDDVGRIIILRNKPDDIYWWFKT